MSDPIVVTPIDSGPLKLENVRELHYCGVPLDTDPTVWLCRCGNSANAPFCDGTHNKTGWVGACTPTAPKEARVWEGSRIRTRFDPTLCMHVFYCKPLKELRAQELADDGAEGEAAAREIARVVSTCPSGALTYELKSELSVAPVPDLPAIDIVEGGEVRIRGAWSGVERGEQQPSDVATLCRCGRSQNKPYCDGRHRGRKDFR